MTTPIADLLAEAVEALLETHQLRYERYPAHHHKRDEPCGPGCPTWTRNLAEVALERWRREQQP